jgi:hypothetical protein
MSSPRIIVFAIFDSSLSPLPGQTPTFATYKDDTGTDLPNPIISEIGGGFYKFTPVFDDNHGIAYMIDGGVSASPRFQYNYVRPEDFNQDNILKLLKNRWKVVSNQLVIYDDDGTTVLFTYNLFDDNSLPTMTRIFERVPV